MVRITVRFNDGTESVHEDKRPQLSHFIYRSIIEKQYNEGKVLTLHGKDGDVFYPISDIAEVVTEDDVDV